MIGQLFPRGIPASDPSGNKTGYSIQTGEQAAQML